MSKGKEAEARKSLEQLRGAKHVGIIEAELFRISTNLQMMKGDQEDTKGPIIHFIKGRFLSRHKWRFFIFKSSRSPHKSIGALAQMRSTEIHAQMQ